MNTLAPAFLIRSSSFLQVTRTYMKAWTISNFNQIPPPTPELSGLARLKNCCEHSSVYIFDWIFFIFSGNEDNQQVWTEFEFWPDPTKRCRVTVLDKCPKLVFAKYLENRWTEFNQILYTHYHWRDLCCYSKASFFANLQRSYSPWLMSEIGFCSISLEWMDRIQPNFVYTWSSTTSILIL